ncbi:hypothetical protein AAFF_G00224360 [Aldrovandia affinis]|uniref:Uncharacterized protein n=1 Tax=Aldrovandia affinis TaxID=143900 RepID=A0AAD7TB98_9TELE|nr:hypothetical protein AAFF_G00224360 [Aldrovandia affinis]
MMMSSGLTQSLETMAHSKRPRLQSTVGIVVPAGVAGHSHGEPVSYSAAIFSCCPRGQEGPDAPPACVPADPRLQTGGGPVIHHAIIEQPSANRIIYGLAKTALTAGCDPPSMPWEAGANQKLWNYDDNPSGPGVLAVMPVRKGSVSLQAAGLAVPKPVYALGLGVGARTGCGCPAGPSFSMERGPPWTQPSICKEDRMFPYGPVPLLQQGNPGQTARQVALRQASQEGCHAPRLPAPPMLPALTEPDYSRFPLRSHAHLFVRPSSKQYQRLQFPSQTPPTLPYTYEWMQQAALSHPGLPRMHQDHSPVPKCLPLPQQPMFLYPRLGVVETENAMVHEDMGGKHFQVTSNEWTPQNTPRQVLFSDSVTPQGHPFHTSVDLSPYRVYAVDHHTGQKRFFLEGPGAPPLVQGPAQPERARVGYSPRALSGRPRTPGAFTPIPPRSRYTHPHRMPVPDPTFRTPSGHRSDGHLTVVELMSAKRALLCCTVDHRPSCTEAFAMKNHKARDSRELITVEMPPQKQTADRLDEAPGEQQDERESGQGQAEDRPRPTLSPPMPVINNVFSLAPYKAYFEVSGAPRNVSRGSKLGPDSQGHKTHSQQNSDETAHGPKPLRVKSEVAPPVWSCVVKHEESEMDRPCRSPGETGVKMEGGEVEASSCSSSNGLDLSVRRMNDSGGSAQKFQTSPHGSCPLLNREAGAPASNGAIQLTACCTLLQGTHTLLPLSAQREPPNPAESSPSPDPAIQARHRLLELHRSLCQLICCSTRHATEQELRDWLAKSEQCDSTPRAGKQCDSATLAGKQHSSAPLAGKHCDSTPSTGKGLPDAGAREVWLRYGGVALALAQVTALLELHITVQDWPFPHVLRAGAVFVPVLLLKETLFPRVPGFLVDRALQGHRVELRPATLSEERLLTRLHGAACSSKLRKLLSLKHLPHLYPDLLHLLYHTCVSKRLGVELNIPVKRQRVEHSREAKGSSSSTRSPDAAQAPEPQKGTRGLKIQASCKRPLRTGRGKAGRRRRRRVLGMEGPPRGELSGSRGVGSPVSRDWERPGNACGTSTEEVCGKPEEEEKGAREATGEPESTWGSGVSQEPSSRTSEVEMETESTSVPSNPSLSPSSGRPQALPVSPCSVKLKKLLFRNPPTGRDTVQNPGADAERPRCRPAHLRFQRGRGVTGGGQMGRGISKGKHPRMTERRQGTRGRPPSGSPELLRLRSSAMQIKRCPYLWARRGGRHVGRWALRPVARATSRAMRDRYPELVGKTIHHLYEEKDKSEMWYRGWWCVFTSHTPTP